MAKIKWGMVVVDGRGKLGGQVFSKNRSGAIIRTKVTPSNGNTVRQSFIRALLASISQAWSTLEPGIRAGFNAAVSDWSTTDIFGDARNPTGKNLYSRLNLNLENSGQAQVTSVPVKIEVPILEGSTVSIDVDTMTLTDAVNTASGVVVVSATAPQSAGTSFFKGKYRQIGFYPGTAIATADFWDNYVAKFGTPETSANIGFEFKLVMPNGQTGQPLRVTGTQA